MVPNWFLDHLQPFLVKPFFDQVPNKGFALLAAGQFATRLQEFGLWGSYLDGSWQAMPSITTFLTPYGIISNKKIVHLFQSPEQDRKNGLNVCKSQKVRLFQMFPYSAL